MTQYRVTFHFRADEPFDPDALFFADDDVYHDDEPFLTGTILRLYEGGPWTGVPMAMYQEVMGVLVGAGLVGPVITSHDWEEIYEQVEGELDSETGEAGDEDGEDAHSGGGSGPVSPAGVDEGGVGLHGDGVEDVHSGVGA